MVKPFSKSKRVPVRLRHKIEKASAAKQRKQRKLAKSNPEWRSRLKKDPGIPNLFPYKDKILAEIEEKKRKKTEDAQHSRDAAAASKSGVQAAEGVEKKDLMEEEDDAEDVEEMDEDDEDDEDNKDGTSDPMAALLASAQARAAEYDDPIPPGDDNDEDDEANSYGQQKSSTITTNFKNPDSSRHAFDKIFKQVLDAADVILYVLDARDPEGTRSKEVERQIMSAQSGSKRLVLVLNKIDLVPADVLKGWLIHLRRFFPTIPLRGSSPASNAQVFDHKDLTPKNTSETLLRALKSYAVSKQLKRSISVGVLGYPNVGKSSIINALTSRLNKGIQSSACPVGAEAGVTTSLREVKIDNKLKILDSPGIVFPSTSTSTEASQSSSAASEAQLILLNALPPAQINDPIPAITLLLSRLTSTSPSLYSQFLQYYNVTPATVGAFAGRDTTADFLVQVARNRGRLGRGGVPNLHAAAMTVLTDWRDGRVRGWVGPPSLKVEGGEGESQGVEGGGDRKEIVQKWSEEFKLEGLWGDR